LAELCVQKIARMEKRFPATAEPVFQTEELIPQTADLIK
jgi:hypothetical protein